MSNEKCEQFGEFADDRTIAANTSERLSEMSKKFYFLRDQLQSIKELAARGEHHTWEEIKAKISEALAFVSKGEKA